MSWYLNAESLGVNLTPSLLGSCYSQRNCFLLQETASPNVLTKFIGRSCPFFCEATSFSNWVATCKFGPQFGDCWCSAGFSIKQRIISLRLLRVAAQEGWNLKRWEHTCRQFQQYLCIFVPPYWNILKCCHTFSKSAGMWRQKPNSSF